MNGMRSTGDMNTAMGNCLISVALVYGMMSQLGISTEDYEILDNGDDCVIIVREQFTDRVIPEIPLFFGRAGFVMKVERPVSVIEEIEFCQTHPVFDGCNWRMVRNIPQSLSKDAFSLKPIDHPGVYPRYMKAFADCGLALTNGLPVCQSYYLAYDRAAGDVKPLTDPIFESGMWRMAKGLDVKVTPVSDLARLSFFKAFGYTSCQQRAIERYYDSVDIHW